MTPISFAYSELRSKKISIIIPSYNHLEDCLKPCLESLKEFCDFDEGDIEVIVVANGCTDGTKAYVDSLGDPFKIVWLDDPSGYTKSTNEGIKASQGEYLVLLNNDTKLSPQEKNTWLKMMLDPFSDPKMAITGPMKAYCPHAKSIFLIFFCVMVKRDKFLELGLLDEIFNPGFGEDTDFCMKCLQGGYKLAQVPTEEKRYQDNEQKIMIGNFPIYHKGEGTLSDVNKIPIFNTTSNELLFKNRKILQERWGSKKTEAQVEEKIPNKTSPLASNEIKLNLGCGDRIFEGYVNIDMENPKADEKGDARNLSKYEDNSVSEIVAIHLIEHINIHEVSKMLLEWFRVLKLGGKLILEMPDILEICKRFEVSTKEKKYELLNGIYGMGTSEGQCHRWGWYDNMLFEHLGGVGFVNLRKEKPLYDGWGHNFRVVCEKDID